MLFLVVKTSFALEDHLSPAADLATAAVALPNGVGEYLHPGFLLRCVVGIEVDNFAVSEADAEAFLNEHVTFFFLGEGRLATLAALGRCLLLS